MIDHLLFVESLSLSGIRMEEDPCIAMTSAQDQQADSSPGITVLFSFIISGVVIPDAILGLSTICSQY